MSVSFTFANQIRNISIDPNYSFYYSFDIENLYTNVPLDEIVAISANTLYCSYLDPFPFQNPFFLKLIHIARKRVQFNFNNTMYQRIDGISFGEPPWSRTGKYHCWISGGKIIRNHKQTFYKWYVDDSWFSSPGQKSINYIQRWHSPVNSNTTTAYLFFVLVEHTSFSVQNFINRKPTFTGSYTRRGSFCPLRCKVDLIKIFNPSAFMICSSQNSPMNLILSKLFYWRMYIPRMKLLLALDIYAYSFPPSQSLNQRCVVYTLDYWGSAAPPCW